jgi:hypothetical protein
MPQCTPTQHTIKKKLVNLSTHGILKVTFWGVPRLGTKVSEPENASRS